MSGRSGQWQGVSVFVTGHTGFKGGWLSLWLSDLGANVHGYSLAPPTDPNFFTAASVASILASDTRADIRDLARLQEELERARPKVVFHLAAQPLVRGSYAEPIETLDVNVIGTAKVLEAARSVDSVRAVVVVTTDKVYENREWPYAYRENEPLGGRDPYSASKAAAEIVTASYRASFFSGRGHTARIATARAGNVIGGGDWAADRLIPDCLRAFAGDQPVSLRNPSSARPWQHVLEPVSGYTRLAEQLVGGEGEKYARAWNFGPDERGNASVGDVARATAGEWGSSAVVRHDDAGNHPHEAGLLLLDSGLARRELDWEPRWSLADTLARTVHWHKAWLAGEDMRSFSLNQIRDYLAGSA